MSETKTVRRDGFHTIEDARADARGFVAIGGKVEAGFEDESGFGWTGAIVVDDMNKHVDGDFFCGRCAGTGQFITMVENGKPKGPGGQCFRCDGKGVHTQADRARNLVHDMHYVPHGIC